MGIGKAGEKCRTVKIDPRDIGAPFGLRLRLGQGAHIADNTIVHQHRFSHRGGIIGGINGAAMDQQAVCLRCLQPGHRQRHR
ncbi:hypothetical protein JCM17844_08750 [Iodidimonas gelatinilytica]|uniref:Uncharacterized protein n=1 Tax=Iodidimonas gelatinilytica TaxID=1236966 RepID=A0A5A7MQK2_9PROT|nr:hypothetical protein [Iodidimonas gelatinilytica]GEQ97238.1 hypothetical protein JCM17844_08750 [Iodidimonas gelatinilytica]